MRFTPAVLLAALLSGCGSISINADDIDDFSPQSQVYLRKASSAGQTHEFVLSSVGDYCRLRRDAEQARIDAQAAYQARLDAGEAECESFDQLVDDLHDAYRSLERAGARQLRIELDRADVGDTPEATTAPQAGTYNQLGVGDTLGGFTAQLTYWEDDWWGAYAEAYACLDPENLDLDSLIAFQTDVAPSSLLTYIIDAGDLELAGGDDGAWDITLTGDILVGSSTAGTMSAEFTTELCEISVVDDEIE